MTWASNGKSQVSFTLPKSLPSGEYLLRVEHIGLHSAGSAGGAQFYVSCAQVKVEGGGSGTPGPLVAFPGAYSKFFDEDVEYGRRRCRLTVRQRRVIRACRSIFIIRCRRVIRRLDRRFGLGRRDGMVEEAVGIAVAFWRKLVDSM